MAIERFPTRPQYWPVPETGSWTLAQRKMLSSAGYQVTFSHPLDDLGKGDDGGPWLLEKTDYRYKFAHINKPAYRGPVLPWDNNSFGNPAIGALRSDASYYADGARAIAATEPSKPVFNGATAIAEATQDGLPAMVGAETWKAQTLRAKQAGSDYLNYQFAWVPLVSDLRDFATAVNNSSTICLQMRQESDMKIRRTLELNHNINTQAETSVQFIRTLGLKSVGSAPTAYTATLDERTWFSGCFRFYVPLDNSNASKFRRYRAYARRLLGADLTPEVVWNVAPWSWAVDWKTDVGAVIHNWSALGHNGLVLQYGYIMHSQESVWHAIIPSLGCESETRIVRKRRVAANPYGFGVSQGSLSTSQVAVLAALGLSRGNSQVVK